MTIVESTQLKVQGYLTTLGRPELDGDGDFSLRFGSARVFVRVTAWGNEHSLIDIFCFALEDVPPSPELFEYVATNNDYAFGKLRVVRRSEGACMLGVNHSMLGTFIDPEELVIAVRCVAETADALDDELKPRFGGHRFHET